MLETIVLNEVYGMSPEFNWHCWNIMQCEKEECSARENGDKPCWVVASELEDYRAALNVCSDCLVFVSRQKNTTLSKEEIEEILKKKGVCVLKEKCSKDE